MRNQPDIKSLMDSPEQFWNHLHKESIDIMKQRLAYLSIELPGRDDDELIEELYKNTFANPRRCTLCGEALLGRNHGSCHTCLQSQESRGAMPPVPSNERTIMRAAKRIRASLARKRRKARRKAEKAAREAKEEKAFKGSASGILERIHRFDHKTPHQRLHMIRSCLSRIHQLIMRLRQRFRKS